MRETLLATDRLVSCSRGRTNVVGRWGIQMPRVEGEQRRTELDLGSIRARFPALEREQAGRRVAYFDAPGGTQVPSGVVDAMSGYLVSHNSNTHWAFPTSEETDAALARARATLADFLGASAGEIAFGNNMTTLTFHLSRAIGRSLEPGDEILVTDLDHHANVAPWIALEQERGVRVRRAPILEPGILDERAFERLLSPKTRLVALGAASNAIGTVNDVARLGMLAREVGALVFVDAVHLAPHERIDVQALGCDFLACSAYKFYGPHVGVLFGKEERLASLDLPKLDPAPNTVPERVETGTQNHEGIVGAAAAVDFLASLASPDGVAGGSVPTRIERLDLAFEELQQRGGELFERMWAGLARIRGVRPIGLPPGEPRTPTLAFTVGDEPSERVAARLAREFGVFVSHGDFYAPTVLERLGRAKQGWVRAGCAIYSTEEEIDRLIEGVAASSRG